MVTKYGYWHLWMCKCKHRCATAPRDQVILKPCVYSSGRLTKLDELFVLPASLRTPGNSLFFAIARTDMRCLDTPCYASACARTVRIMHAWGG